MNPLPSNHSGRSSINLFAQPAAQPADAGTTLNEADLHQIERALLDALLDVHPNRTNALDRLLDDMDAADGSHDDTSAAGARDAGHSRRKQVEDLLVAAVSDTSSDRNRELERLLGGSGDAGIQAAYA